jgi:peptidoglycan/LPS O-acetylase OafA/YrhL
MNPANTERQHYSALDGLRGAATLTIVLYHNFAFTQQYIFFGWLSVDLFFTLSGFLITDILMKAVTRPHYLRNFYARRLLRIFPLYYISLIIFLLILPRLNTALNLGYYQEHQAWLWTYLQNWLYIFRPSTGTDSLNHLWSLAVEEQFYLVWPFIILLVRKPKWLLLAISVLLVSVIGLRLWIWMHHLSGFSYYNLYTFTRIDGICIGSMVAILLRINPCFLKKFTPLVVLFFAVINLGFYFINSYYRFSFPYLALVGYTTFAMLLGLLVNEALTKENKLVNTVFNFSFLRFIGKVSYGFYIFHWPMYLGLRPFITDFAKQFTGEWAADFAASLIASLVALLLSWFSFTYFESYFLKMKDKFA